MWYNKFGILCVHVYKPSAKLKGGKWTITHSWEICIKPRDYSKEMRYDKWGRLRKHIYKPRAKLKGGEWIIFRDWEGFIVISVTISNLTVQCNHVALKDREKVLMLVESSVKL